MTRGALVFLFGFAMPAYAAPMLRLTTTVVFPLPVTVGAAPTTQTIEAFNIGDGSLALTVRVPPSITWLSASVGAAGACTTVDRSSCIPLRFTLNTASLAAGTYTAGVTVEDPHAIDSPQVVTVTVRVGSHGSHSRRRGDVSRDYARHLSFSRRQPPWRLPGMAGCGFRSWSTHLARFGLSGATGFTSHLLREWRRERIWAASRSAVWASTGAYPSPCDSPPSPSPRLRPTALTCGWPRAAGDDLSLPSGNLAKQSRRGDARGDWCDRYRHGRQRLCLLDRRHRQSGPFFPITRQLLRFGHDTLQRHQLPDCGAGQSRDCSGRCTSPLFPGAWWTTLRSNPTMRSRPATSLS